MHDCGSECSAGSVPCPACGAAGRTVQIVTPKSLLTPEALARLEPNARYHFCPDAKCRVVYFAGDLTFSVDDVIVDVFQKARTKPLPVCYCFGFTRERIEDEIGTGCADPMAQISAHVRAGRCACEFRNPQGTCCLGNVGQVIRQPREARP